MPEEAENGGVSAAQIRGVRAKQPWVRYDSVVIGPGARNIGGRGWFDTWAAAAAAESWTFNDGTRTKAVGVEYCNSSGDTEDWFQKVMETRIEFFSPPGLFGAEDRGLDAGVFQTLFAQEFPRRTWAEVVLADTDTYLQVPCVMLPSNLGVEWSIPGIGGIAASVGGHTGEADFSAGWRWPKGLEIPAKSKLGVILRIGRPLKQCLQQLVNIPGNAIIPTVDANGEPIFVECPNWYVIRVSHWGPRFLQLRGATSA